MRGERAVPIEVRPVRSERRSARPARVVLTTPTSVAIIDFFTCGPSLAETSNEEQAI